MSGKPLEDAIREPWLRDILAAWRSWRGPGGDVPRAAIDPSTLPRAAVQFLFLYEQHGERWRCSLAGTGIAHRAGYDPSNRYLDQMLGDRALRARSSLFRETIATGRACVYTGWLAVFDRPPVRFERLLLPVTGRVSGARDTLFGAVAFAPTNAPASTHDVAQLDFIAWDDA
ncbi:MAG: hypothetical protein JWM77_4150 [Rhodospirillales bacterium]|nr:hypothetical protein [Rhodospirillales bacterium]